MYVSTASVTPNAAILNLAPDRSYTFTVAAYFGKVTGPWSNTITGKTAASAEGACITLLINGMGYCLVYIYIYVICDCSDWSVNRYCYLYHYWIFNVSLKMYLL